MMKAQPQSHSMQMPTVKLALGKYVVLKRRADGTHRVLFQVPPRLRPSGWSPAIPLPLKGDRTGQLNGAEVAAIQQDAVALYAELQAIRTGVDEARGRRSLRALVDSWQLSQAWHDLKPKSRTTYGTYVRNITAWDDSGLAGDPTRITRDDVLNFIKGSPGGIVSKKHTLKTLRIVMDQAVAKGWRLDNPCHGIRMKTPISKAGVWERADVDAYVAAAREMNRESIALVILLEWEIGQRLTDVRAFRPGAEYDAEAGMFRFWQSKTGSYVTVRVSDTLRALLAKAGDGELFLFRDEATGNAYAEDRLSKVFGQVRDRAVKVGARPLQLRWLRHSCVVQLARAECTNLDIASITGHAPGSVSRIMSIYCPRDSQMAEGAQRKRGLI